MSQENLLNQRAKGIITPRAMIFKYVRFLPWVAISVAFALVGAYVKLRYSTPIYSISGKLLVRQPPYNSGGEKFDDIFMMQRSDKLNDEIEIIRSRSMATRVVNSLGLQMQIYNKGKIRSTVLYPADAAFNFEVINIADSAVGFNLLITLLPNGQFVINDQTKKYFYNEQVNWPSVNFRITSKSKRTPNAFASNEFVVSWTSAEGAAAGLSGTLGVSRVNDFANVLQLSYQTEDINLGVDIINQYMKEYQQANLQDKREIAAKTLTFIDDQLKAVFSELGNVEQNLKNYREKNRVINPQAQSEMFFGELAETNRVMAEHEVKSKITDYLKKYISEESNKYKIIPSMLGIAEPTLLQQATEFNKLQLERETALKTTAPNNPRMQLLETAIEKLRNDMLENLKNLQNTEAMALAAVKGKNQQADRLINSIPSKEKQLLEVTRQQSILQELYQYLLQKKLETAIGSASTISNIMVVEPAMVNGGPIGPNKKGLYMLAIVLGIAVPGGILLIKEYLNDKISSKQEIEQLTKTPILGEIGHSEDGNVLVVTRNDRRFLAEQFRIIRSNLQYILPNIKKPVLLVTSSFSGEGKSFISTNLGSVLALSGKRTVILEFDIRKPKILKGLGLHERKGLTNFIVGSINLNEVIHPVPDVENLYVVPCGPVPPNPAEMLLQEKVDQLFKELRSEFDAIIIDSAPVGLVSDAITLGKYADGTIYVVRHDYTLKNHIQIVDEVYVNKKLPNPSIIVNDITVRGGYGYYGYGTYGYGYGYGVNETGENYFENRTKKSSIHKFFKRPAKK